MEDKDVDSDPEVLDFRRGLSDAQKEKLVEVGRVQPELIAEAQSRFKASGKKENQQVEEVQLPETCTVYEHKDFPGVSVSPGERYAY